MFELFSRQLADALSERGFTEPTEPQTMLVPVIMSGKNALLMAPTGTGKTEAAFLPILDIMIRQELNKVKGVKLLYITPLRALNRDMLERMQWWCKRFDFRLGVRHGDTTQAERTNLSIVPPDVLITTPETLQIMLVGKRIRQSLDTLRWVVVDEVHELAEDKRGSQLCVALERLRTITKKEPQIIGLSATVGSPEKVAKFLVGNERECEVIYVPVEKSIDVNVVMPEPEEIDREIAEKIYTFPEVASRLRYIKEKVEQYKSVLIFTNTRSEAEAIANRFRVWLPEFPVGIHHSSLSRTTREEVERQIKEGSLYGVICTSSLELGIDIGFLKYVLQYNSPRQVTRLVQRIGRSGHKINEVSRGTIICQDSDDFLEASVLCRRARKGMLEELNPYVMPRDVAIHQIAGLLIERQRISVDEIIELFRKSYPYRDIDREYVKELISYMVERYPRLAFYSESDETLSRPRDLEPLFEYYFENVSMIPEEKQYLVYEGDNFVGVLDEAFVAEYGEVGTKFVVSGLCWRIEQVYGDRVFVKREEDPAGAVPHWVGDEIPVPYEVAQEVGMLRRMYSESKDKEEFLRWFVSNYPASIQDARKAMSEVREQEELGMQVPSDRSVTVEKWEDYAVINTNFGHKVNRLIARIIAYIITERTGQSVSVHQDPYRIVIDTELSAQSVANILTEISEIDIGKVAEEAVVRTGIFKRRLIHAGKKCGAISKDADYASVSISGLIEALRRTPVYKEAIETIFHDDFDLHTARIVLEKIRKGEIAVSVIEGLSPISRIGLEEISRRGEIVSPERMRALIKSTTASRLNSTYLVCACTSCWKFVEARKVEQITFLEKCPVCGSDKIGVTSKPHDEVFSLSMKVRSGSALNKRYRKLLDEINQSCEMRKKYGHVVELVLAGKGLRLSDAKKVYDEVSKGRDAIEAIIEQEREALRRRYFLST